MLGSFQCSGLDGLSLLVKRRLSVAKRRLSDLTFSRRVSECSTSLPDEFPYELESVLGAGSFGVVHQARNIDSGKACVVKVIDLGRAPQAFALGHEVAVQGGLEHPNISKIFDTFRDNSSLYLVMELCRGDDLSVAIDAIGDNAENDATFAIRQILSAASYLYARKVCHRDLKPDNCLLKRHGVPLVENTIKVIDFGLATHMVPGKLCMRTRCGSPCYMAPEVVRGKAYDEKCDIWSCGVILYNLLSAEMPFEGSSLKELSGSVVSEPLKFKGRRWDNVTESMKSLVTDMCDKNPRRRPHAHQCLLHPCLRLPEDEEAVPGDASCDSMGRLGGA